MRPLADPLPAPRPGDWLAVHHQAGQAFAEYLDARPIRRNDRLNTIDLCFIGDFNSAQRRILDLTRGNPGPPASASSRTRRRGREVPPEILDDREALLSQARQAIEAGQDSQSKVC